MAHFIDGTELGADLTLEIALRALELRSGALPTQFPGTRLAGVFLNPSLRTRMSMQAACGALGIQPLIVDPGSTSWQLEYRDGVVMDKDAVEHVADAVRTMTSYADLLAVRAFAGLVDVAHDRADPVINAFARYSPVPVVNMESARWHPLQGLADVATWVSQLGPDFRGQPLTLTWAPHPKSLPQAVPNQVLVMAAMLGMDVTVAHPEGFDLDPELMQRSRELAASNGGAIGTTTDQDSALRGARIVVAKSWGGFSYYGKREQEAEQRKLHRDWMVTEEKMALTDEAGFMHCLPVRRNVVVTDGVIDGPDSWVYETAGLRMWTAMALLERLLQGA